MRAEFRTPDTSDREPGRYAPRSRTGGDAGFQGSATRKSSMLRFRIPSDPDLYPRIIRSVSGTIYWMELATEEKTLLAFDPTRRTVPTTITRITASITAYSAISCPDSSLQSLQIVAIIRHPPKIGRAHV